MSTVAEISEAIEKLDVKDQVKLLQVLPQHLKIAPDDLAWTRLAETAFEFWNNPEDDKLVSLHRQLVVKRIGALPPPSLAQVLANLRQLF